jgi:hypothetical protein
LVATVGEHSRTETSRERVGVFEELTMVTRTLISDLDPKTQEWMQRASDEYLRRHKRFRELVMRMLSPPDDQMQPEDNGVFQTRIVRMREPESGKRGQAKRGAKAGSTSSGPYSRPEREMQNRCRAIIREFASDEPTPKDLARALREAPGEPIPRALLDYVITRFVLQTVPRKQGRKTATPAAIAIIAFYRHQLHKARQRMDAEPATRAKKFTAKKFGISVSTLEHLMTDDRRRRTYRSVSQKPSLPLGKL